MQLQGRVALVTGAGRGIGEATAKLLAANGATVVCADIQEDLIAKVVDDIKSAGGQAGAARLDVTNKEEVKTIFGQIVKKYDRFDILINNAGITRDELAMRMSEESFDRVVKINLHGTFFPCQAAIIPMRKNRWGRIVNTASVAALGNPGQANYSASKGAVISLTKTLALELAKSGITVNAVAPGAILTPMLEQLPEDVRSQYIAQIPVGRFGTPEEIAKIHYFFCSDAADYITGQVLFVDGGMSVGL